MHQTYTNADLKICHYLRLHMKIICSRFHIITPFTFLRYAHVEICEKFLYKHSEKKKLQTSRTNNLIILRIKNATFSVYCFHMNANIYWDFQSGICVPLTSNYSIMLIGLSHFFWLCKWLPDTPMQMWKDLVQCCSKN